MPDSPATAAPPQKPYFSSSRTRAPARGGGESRRDAGRAAANDQNICVEGQLPALVP